MSSTAALGPMKAIAYLRVSTDGQVESGAGIEAQRSAISAAVAGRGWQVSWAVEDGRSARNMNRPVLTEALTELDAGRAKVLIVSKLDRLSRSVHDFSGLLMRAEKKQWALVCLDIGVDTTTPAGSFMVNVMVSAAEYERRLIGQRTRDALAAKRAAGIKLGRPRLLPDSVIQRIAAEHAEGRSLRSIAVSLTADGVKTAHGASTWSHVVVAKVLRSDAGRDALSNLV